MQGVIQHPSRENRLRDLDRLNWEHLMLLKRRLNGEKEDVLMDWSSVFLGPCSYLVCWRAGK